MCYCVVCTIRHGSYKAFSKLNSLIMVENYKENIKYMGKVNEVHKKIKVILYVSQKTLYLAISIEPKYNSGIDL